MSDVIGKPVVPSSLQLETLLVEGDIRVVSVWDESEQLIAAVMPTSAEPLRQEIASFRFERALQMLRDLRRGLPHSPLADPSVSGRH
jgi:hypothetical protein